MLFRSDRKSTRLNSSHTLISYAVFCLKKKKTNKKEEEAYERNHRPAYRHRTAGERVAAQAPLFLPFPLLFYLLSSSFFFFFFNDTATTEIYPLSLHDALPIFTLSSRMPSSAYEMRV